MPAPKVSEEKVKDFAYHLADKAENLGNSIEKLSHDIGRDLGTVAKTISDKTNDTFKKTKEYVEESPVQSVLIGAAAGFVLGSLFTFLMKKK